MKSEEFEAKGWIERLTRALSDLSRAQEPFLQEYWRRTPRKHVLVDGRDETPFPLDDLQMLYARVCHGGVFGEHEYYATLTAAIDPVRSTLRSHPTLWRAVGPLIDNDDFWVQMRGQGSLTSLSNLIGGLMARADELPGDGFHAAARELHAHLDPAEGKDATAVPGDLDIGYDVVLFHGLCLEEEIDIGGGLTMLPFERARAFVDESVLKDTAPDVVRFRDWRLVGAVVRPFRWRPIFRRRGPIREVEAEPPELFVRGCAGVSGTLGGIPPITDRVSGSGSGMSQPVRLPSARAGAQARIFPKGAFGVSVLPGANPPGLRREALEEARAVLRERKGDRYGKLAPVVARLAEALARNGRFAAEDRILDVAIALERMYELSGGEISHKMRIRASWFLGRGAGDRVLIMQSVKKFYGVRSEIVHNRKRKTSSEKYREAFDTGFDIAARTLFKLLKDGPPDDWEEMVIAGSYSCPTSYIFPLRAITEKRP